MSEINTKAPVQARAQAVTTATRSQVFDVLADLSSWSTVYPELRDLQADGPAAVGTAFRFKSGPMQIEATVTAFEQDRLIAFEGKGKGASSQYRFELDDVQDGTTITAQQSMDGLAVKTMKPMLQKIADTSLQDWVEAIGATAASA